MELPGTDSDTQDVTEPLDQKCRKEGEANNQMDNGYDPKHTPNDKKTDVIQSKDMPNNQKHKSVNKNRC